MSIRTPRLEKYKGKGVAKTSCIFYGKRPGGNSPLVKGPLCTLTTYATCDPSTCPWYKSEEMMQESYEKARQNYLRQTGKDLYHRLGYDKFLKKRKSEEVPFDVDE